MASPDVYAAMDHAVASALARARELMTILDREHDSDTLHAQMRAVRHELDTLDDLFPVIGIATVTVPQAPVPPPPVKQEQDSLPL